MSVHGLSVALASVLLCTHAAGVQVMGNPSSARASVLNCIREYADGLDEVRENLSWGIRQHPLKMAHTSQRNLTICPGSGTSATRSLHYALGSMGVCSWHFEAREPWYQGTYDTMRLVRSPEVCHKELQAFDYTSLPGEVEAVGDTPVAELFLDMFLAFPNAKVILIHRPSMEWAKSRLQFEPDARAAIQEPCGTGMQMKDFTIPESARLEDLKNDLIRCMVPKENLLVFSPWTDTPARMRTIMDEIASFMGRTNEKGLLFPGISAALDGRRYFDVSAETRIAVAAITNACKK